MARAARGQGDLFGPALPDGFAYQPELISPDEEAVLVGEIAELPFAPFEFHGWLGARRVVSFGWRYDYAHETLREAGPPPDFLLELRQRLAVFGRDPDCFRQVLVTEYAPGAGIGWHRDKPQFDEVIGVSLAAACVFRFRRREGPGWARASLTLQPRSAYLISGAARSEWEHSIPQVEALRYSITFRSRKP